MPQSFQAAVVVIVALLPGALYVWAFERQAGRYGIGLSDRVLRFFGGSALFLAAFAMPLYWLYSNYAAAVVNARPLPMSLTLFPLGYVVLPLAPGTVIGYVLRQIG